MSEEVNGKQNIRPNTPVPPRPAQPMGTPPRPAQRPIGPQPRPNTQGVVQPRPVPTQNGARPQQEGQMPRQTGPVPQQGGVRPQQNSMQQAPRPQQVGVRPQAQQPQGQVPRPQQPQPQQMVQAGSSSQQPRPTSNVAGKPAQQVQGQTQNQQPQVRSTNMILQQEQKKTAKQKQEEAEKKALEEKAKALQQKYNKQRKINTKVIAKRGPVKMLFGILFNIVCTLLIIASIVLCFSSVNSNIQHVCPNFAGYSNLKIVSGSMTKSGHNIDDTVIVRAVNTHTLKGAEPYTTIENGQEVKHFDGDIIAFYRYSPSYTMFNPAQASLVDTSEIGQREYILTFPMLFGFQNDEIKNAANHGADIIFHHIVRVLKDENGERWFMTQGSSNETEDVGQWVNEKYVVGVYDDSGFGKVMSGLIGTLSSSGGIGILIIPVVIMAIFIIMQCLRDIQYAKLEYDVVEEKRKITDEICVKNEIGYRMDTKTKYKVLVQASEKDWPQYISLLWREGKAPESIKKYAIRKQIMLRPVEKLLQVNRNCQKMFKDGVDPIEVAKYYTTEKAKIEQEQVTIQRYMRKRRKHYDELELEKILKEQEKSYSGKKSRKKTSVVAEQNLAQDAMQQELPNVVESFEENNLVEGTPKKEKKTTTKTATKKPTSSSTTKKTTKTASKTATKGTTKANTKKSSTASKRSSSTSKKK